jgi:DNA primase
MSIETLLSKLDKARRTGKDSHIACCPAHDDKSPSLTIRELDDGRILLHCFGGCDVESVLSSIGMTFDDLFPRLEIQHGKPERRPFPAADVLRAIAFEAIVIAQAGRVLLNKSSYTEADQERLVLAVQRVQAAVSAGGLRHA